MKGEASAVEGFYIRLQHVPREAFSPHTSAISTPGALQGLPGGVGGLGQLRSEFSVSGIHQQNAVSRSLFHDDLEGNSSVVTVLNAGTGLSSYVLQGLHNYRAYTLFMVPFFDTFEGRPSNSKAFVTPVAGELRFDIVTNRPSNLN